jgi:hypothetical protein
MIDPSKMVAATDAEEHVIPDGTGIHWVRLPSGGTSSQSNGRASDWERQLLREGLMGMLRPFYSGAKKDIKFDAGHGESVVFRNDPNKGFVIETRGLAISVPGGAGGGELQIEIPVTVSATPPISRALSKMAYLALAVLDPVLAFAHHLNDVRAYLTRDDTPYRPYGECFVPGAAPGADVNFDILCEPDGAGELVGTHMMAVIRIHHVKYVIPLIGEFPAALAPSGLVWFPDPVGACTKKAQVVFQYDSIAKVV